MNDISQQRLFFALWPPRPLAERMIDIARTLFASGAPVAHDKLHVTLAFHGACDAVAREALIARAEQVTVPPIDLVFDRLDGFRKPRIAWLGMADPPAGLLDLAALLRETELERRRYIPHITLQRKTSPIAACPVAPIAWRAREFVLAESGANGVPGAYRVLARWPLSIAGHVGPSVE